MVAKKTDAEIVPAIDASLLAVPVYDRNQMSFSDAFDGDVVDEVLGSELLAKDEERLRELIGIPFGITRVVYRHGFPSQKEKGLYLAYVSVEAVIADQEFLDKRKKSLDGTSFRPGEHIVFNDGGTGVYRQITEYLDTKGYITIGSDLPKDGGKEESRYDLPPSKWENVTVGDVHFDDTGFMIYDAPVRLLAPRGIRTSEYTNEFTGPDGAVTYYLG